MTSTNGNTNRIDASSEPNASVAALAPDAVLVDDVRRTSPAAVLVDDIRRTRKRLIRTHTVAARPVLCPELLLYQATPDCDLWRASEERAAELGFRDPYWAFCWAGGQALARYALDQPHEFAGRLVLDLGAGGGISGIAAARAGAHVTASDIDPMAVDAIELNAELNDVHLETTEHDLVGSFEQAWDVVLVGDVCYDRALARRLLSWLRRVAAAGARVLIGDPDRGFIDTSQLSRVATYEAPADNDKAGSFFVRTTIYEIAGISPHT